MLTRKGKAKCDSCGLKHDRHMDFDFLVLIDFSVNDGFHYCSWECLLNGAAEACASALEPSDFE